MAKKKSEEYKCETCGLVVLVQDPCGCQTECLTCCGEPMQPIKETKSAASSKTTKASKATKAKAKPKTKPKK